MQKYSQNLSFYSIQYIINSTIFDMSEMIYDVETNSDIELYIIFSNKDVDDLIVCESSVVTDKLCYIVF